jgi:hypothetical protein
MSNTTAATSVYETYQFASFDTLKNAFYAGQLTEKQVRVLLARKDYSIKAIGYTIKDWKSMKTFLAEESK